MRDHKPITIAVSRWVIRASNTDGDRLTVEVPWDADAQDMLAAFRTVLFWLGYGNPDDIVPDPWREWGYLDEKEEPNPETHIPAEDEAKACPYRPDGGYVRPILKEKGAR